MSDRPILPFDALSSEAQAAVSSFHRDVVEEVRAAVERDEVVVVGMAQNPHVKKARQALDEAKIPFTYLEYGSYLKGWKRRLAIKMWSGWPTYPQVFVRGVLIGGNSDLRKALADGSVQRRLGG